MAQDDGGVQAKVQGAKTALAHAQSMKFPARPAAKPAAPISKPVAAPVKASNFDGGADIAAGLKAREDNVKQYMNANAVPKMHNGGPVIGDGPRMLKDGEHVLTAAEAKKARKHGLMAVGLKSLAKEVPAKKPMAAENDEEQPMPSKKPISDIKVRPEKNASAKIKIS